MTATEQSSKEQPPVTGSSTASSMDVDNSSTKTDTEKSLPSTDDMRAKPSEAIELPSDDEFGDDVPVFDESDVLDGRTDSLLTSIKSEMSKQGIEIRGGDSQAGNTAVEGLLSIVNGASSESLEQQEGNVTNSEDVEEEKLPLEESFSLKELIDMMKEESLKKIDEPEDKSTKRFEQLTKIIDEIQSLEKGRESTTVKIHLAVKIEAIQSASSTNSAIKCWKELIEDLDLDLKTRKSKAQKRIADKEKIQELKKLKQPIPRELTKKGHAKIMAEVAQAQKEIKTLRKKVSKLESKELSLADMDKEDNAFLKVGQLSKRINFLVKKVARLQGCTINYRRSIYQPIKYEESKYDDINEAISKEVTKLIKEKRLDPNTKLKGMAPDFKDIDDIVRNTGTGKLMKEGEIHAESQTIFKSIIDELRTRRQQELSEFFDQYESDEELSKTDVHETNDEELEKKLISLDEAREKIDKVVKEFVSKVELMTPEDLAKDEAEALKEEEEEEKAAAEMAENEDLDDEESEEGDEGLEGVEDIGVDVENNQPSQESASEIDTIKSKEESDDDDSDDEAVGSNGENELVDLASGDEENASVLDSSEGPSASQGSAIPMDTSNAGNMAPDFEDNGEEDDTIEPPLKKLKKTTDMVEEITLSSDEGE